MPRSSLPQRVAEFLRRQRLPGSDDLIVVGVSGGVDSMVLLDVLVRLDVQVLAAHVNYGLRGAESDADEELVRRRCADLNITLESARYETKRLAAEKGASVQEIARDLRYAFFNKVAAAAGARAVAVAHHADDQAETLLLNLFRGTGLEGLAGMPSARSLAPDSPVMLIRPLLTERRADLESYARAHEVPWREDASNGSADYRRTFLRHEVLPRASEIFGGDVADRLVRTAGFVRDYLDASFEPDLRAAFDACSDVLPVGGRLLNQPLLQQPSTWRSRIVLEALRRWIPSAPLNATVAERIVDLLDSQVGRRVHVDGGMVWRERDALEFITGEGVDDTLEPVELPLEKGEYPVPGGTLAIRSVELPCDVPREDAYAELMDANALADTLTVRTWQPGDEIRPLGMKGRKRVSDLLTDERVPSHTRDRVLVLESGEEIVWVIGVRLAETVRLRPESNRAWLLTFSPSDLPA